MKNNLICWICGCKPKVIREDLNGYHYCKKHYTKVLLKERKQVLENKRAKWQEMERFISNEL